MGSAAQINLLVIPFTVLAGWFLNQPMTLHFPLFETVVLFISVNVVSGIVNDGKSNWLEGVLLLVLYGIIAINFLFIGENTLMDVDDF